MEFYSAKMTQQESLPLSLASIISTAGMEVEGMLCHADVQKVWVLLHTSLSYKYLFIYLFKSHLTFKVEPFTSSDLSSLALCYLSYQAGTHSC